VSLLWRDRLVVAIYPDRLAWLRTARRWPSRVTAKGIVSCPVISGEPWRSALSILPEILHAAEAGGLHITALLSNRLSRYAVVPNPDSARNRDELDLLARHSFARTHGDAVAGWAIRLSDAAPGRAALASALDRELVTSMRETIAAVGARLISIQPYLMAAFNRQQRTFSRRDGVFVVAEPERVTVLAWKDTGWCGVQQIYATDDWMDGLAGILERLAVTAGLKEGCPLRVCAPELTDGENIGALWGLDAWKIETFSPAWPQGLTSSQDQAFGGAVLALP
jgi:hypothetical protein